MRVASGSPIIYLYINSYAMYVFSGSFSISGEFTEIQDALLLFPMSLVFKRF